MTYVLAVVHLANGAVEGCIRLFAVSTLGRLLHQQVKELNQSTVHRGVLRFLQIQLATASRARWISELADALGTKGVGISTSNDARHSVGFSAVVLRANNARKDRCG